MANEEIIEEEPSWKTYNVRLDEAMIRDLDKIKVRYNVELGLEKNFGHRYTRADILRSTIAAGIVAINERMAPEPAPTPLETPKK